MLSTNKPRPALAHKLDWLLSLPGMDRARLVAATGSKGPSTVSEWRRTGRIAKSKLLKLSELSGVSAEWWLDNEATIPPPDSARLDLSAKAAAKDAESPFALSTTTPDRQARFLELLDKLTPAQQDKLLAEMAAAVATNESVLKHLGGKRLRVTPDEHIERAFGTVDRVKTRS